MMDNNIKSFDEVAHYTTQDGLFGILESRKLWATHYCFLNDSSEMQHGREYINHIFAEVAQMDESLKFRAFAEQFPEDTVQVCWQMIAPVSGIPEFFITSFSGLEDSLKKDGLLSQWRSYGQDGFAIVFDYKKLDESYKNFSTKKGADCLQFDEECEQCLHFVANFFCLVEYDHNLEMIKQEKYKEAYDQIKKFAEKYFKSIKNHSTFSYAEQDIEEAKKDISAIIAFLGILKHSAFREENEVRFFCFNRFEDPKKCGRDYYFESPYEVTRTEIPRLEIDFDPHAIKRIIIGPQPNQDKKLLLIKYRLEEYGYNNVEIVKSSIPYIRNVV